MIFAEESRRQEGTQRDRMLRMVHTYGTMLHIRSQRTDSELPLLMALLLLSHGCGQGID